MATARFTFILSGLGPSDDRVKRFYRDAMVVILREYRAATPVVSGTMKRNWRWTGNMGQRVTFGNPVHYAGTVVTRGTRTVSTRRNGGSVNGGAGKSRHADY